jgi:hypothetical protein
MWTTQAKVISAASEHLETYRVQWKTLMYDKLQDLILEYTSEGQGIYQSGSYIYLPVFLCLFV